MRPSFTHFKTKLFSISYFSIKNNNQILVVKHKVRDVKGKTVIKVIFLSLSDKLKFSKNKIKLYSSQSDK